MARPGYKDLGISSKEYEEALLLERLFKLVKKNPCSTCLLKKPTHVDLDRYELLCTTCSKRCASKVQIGKGLISVGDLERLEAKYDKSKKKEHESSKHKKHRHKARSPSVSSYQSYESYKKPPKHEPVYSDSTEDYHRKPKERSKKKETHRYPTAHEYYPESYEKYPQSYANSTGGYPKYYPEDSMSPHHKSRKDKKEKPRERTRERGRESRHDRDVRTGREFEMGREPDRPREGYPPLPNYPYYQQARYRDYDSYQPGYDYGRRMNRNFTTYDYVNPNRRDVPGMVGLLANQGRDRDMVVRNQWALPPPPEKGFPTRELKSQALALTNGFHAFRSVPNLPKDESISNNPFSKRNFDQSAAAYNFSNMREALGAPKARARYSEPFQPPREFTSTKQGNLGFPDSSANYFNRF